FIISSIFGACISILPLFYFGIRSATSAVACITLTALFFGIFAGLIYPAYENSKIVKTIGSFIENLLGHL
ncbi:MAG: hypothetical protein LBC18_08885, partial [Opitutaceae bacterium]|nr:hypothetical protein [Opitutaceae bacterium]